MKEEKAGTVLNYFKKVGVAAVKLERDVKVGDCIHIKGKATEHTFTLDSMQIDRQTVQQAAAGTDVGIKIPGPVRPGDEMFVQIPE